MYKFPFTFPNQFIPVHIPTPVYSCFNSHFLDLLNSIKNEPSLGTSLTNTYISFSDGSVMDLFGNNVTGISNASALPAARVIADMTPPEVVAFDLDLNEGIISLNFSEIVDITTLNVTGIHLQPRIDSSEVPDRVFTFSMGTLQQVKIY